MGQPKLLDLVIRLYCLWHPPHTKSALLVPVYTVSITTITANDLKLFTIIYSNLDSP
jgi:hypothetical protein